MTQRERKAWNAANRREFIEAGENVTVLGYVEGSARDTKQKFKSEWVHVSTVHNGKITRWRGFYDTAARYGC